MGDGEWRLQRKREIHHAQASSRPKSTVPARPPTKKVGQRGIVKIGVGWKPSFLMQKTDNVTSQLNKNSSKTLAISKKLGSSFPFLPAATALMGMLWKESAGMGKASFLDRVVTEVFGMIVQNCLSVIHTQL